MSLSSTNGLRKLGINQSGDPLGYITPRCIHLGRKRSSASVFGSHPSAKVFQHRTWNQIMYSLLYLLQDFFNNSLQLSPTGVEAAAFAPLKPTLPSYLVSSFDALFSGYLTNRNLTFES